MKDLTKVKIREFVEMSDKEMKHVVAGSAASTTSGTTDKTCDPKASSSTCSGDCTTASGMSGTCKYGENVSGVVVNYCACVATNG